MTKTRSLPLVFSKRFLCKNRLQENCSCFLVSCSKISLFPKSNPCFHPQNSFQVGVKKKKCLAPIYGQTWNISAWKGSSICIHTRDHRPEWPWLLHMRRKGWVWACLSCVLCRSEEQITEETGSGNEISEPAALCRPQNINQALEPFSSSLYSLGIASLVAAKWGSPRPAKYPI